MKLPAFFRLTLWPRTFVAALCLELLFAASGLSAETTPNPQPTAAPIFDATHLREPTGLESAPWLVHAGDDPAYARPDFDDSHWTPFDPRNSLKTIFPNNRPEVVWFRLRIKVPPDQTGLSLEAYNISFAFEIYANGQRILQSGQVAPFKSYTSGARLQVQIPDAQIAMGTVVIASRVYISPVMWDMPRPGLSTGNLTLGQENTLREHIWLKVIGSNLFNWINEFSGLGLGFVAFALFAAQPRQREYLWIFLQFLVAALQLPLAFYCLFHNVPSSWDVANNSFGLLSLVFLVLMYFAFLRIPFGRWMQALLVLVALGYFLAIFGITHGALGLIGAYLALLPLIGLYSVVVPVLLIVHFRRGNREAGILLIPVVLMSLNLYIEVVLGFSTQVHAFATGATHAQDVLNNLHAVHSISRSEVSATCFSPFRWPSSSCCAPRASAVSRPSLKAKSQRPAKCSRCSSLKPSLPCPALRSPAPIGPRRKSAATSSRSSRSKTTRPLSCSATSAAKASRPPWPFRSIVGAIRTVAETTASPAEILACLNRRLYGRLNGGFSTAIAMCIGPDGACALASAGHPAPFLNEREIELPGALPLGVEPAVTYAESSIALGPTDRLALYTDGLPRSSECLRRVV